LEIPDPLLRVRPIGSDKNGWRGRPLRDAPDDVNGAASLIPLENENARPLRVLRVVLKDLCGLHTSENLPSQDTIGRELVISMV
jgi:hypothetical protein